MTTATQRASTSQTELNALLADLLPRQGEWDAEGYLWLTDGTNRLIEFTDGYIEGLPMPTAEHQGILESLFLALRTYLRPRGGIVRFAPLRVQIGPRKFREPDLVALRDAGDRRRENRYWLGADLMLEVVSSDQPQRDLVQKRREYATAKIPEYWIVNPEGETITVLRLEGGAYVEHGVFRRGARATSPLLGGFAVEVDEVFEAD